MTSKIVNLFQQDLDEVFAYHTTLRLVLSSKVIAAVFRVLQILFLIYFFFIVFFVEYGYFYSELADGMTFLHASASGTSLIDQEQPGVWDSIDVSSAFFEGNKAFVAIKTDQFFNQKIDNCADPYRTCTNDNDCIPLVGETCVDGYCNGPNWCTPDGNTQAVEYYVPDRYLFWIKSQASFRTVKAENGFNTLGQETSIMFPKKNANTFSVGQILNNADVLYKEIREEGAIIKVNVYWDCYAGSNPNQCSPTIHAHRIDYFSEDETLGANQVKYTYFTKGGTTYRNTFNMTGILFIFETKATAERFSFNNLVLQVGTLISFLRALYYFFDFVIYNFLPGFENFKREKYTVYDDRKADEDEEDEEKDDKKKKETELERDHESDADRRHYSDIEDDEYAGQSGAESDDLLNDERD